MPGDYLGNRDIPRALFVPVEENSIRAKDEKGIIG